MAKSVVEKKIKDLVGHEFIEIIGAREHNLKNISVSFPRNKLMEEFAKVEHSCLIGSLGLWQGIDVMGPALSLVIVDKLPFARPNDPLAMARREQAEAEGHNPFGTYDLPRAALLLAQGVGRLIRSNEDRGVVAVLDRRLVTSGYGKQLIDSLPPMFRMTSPDRVKAALQRLTGQTGD